MSPAVLPLVAVLILPIVEIYLMIQVGRGIGAIPTILLLLGIGALGTAIARHQGLATLRRMQAAVARGEPPALELLDGVIVLVSGLLLILPGFLSDAVGLLGLIPPVRRLLILWFVRARRVVYPSGPAGRVIEGEVVDRHD